MSWEEYRRDVWLRLPLSQYKELGDNVTIGKNTTMTAEICKKYEGSYKIAVVRYFIVNQYISMLNYYEIDFSEFLRNPR